MITAGIDAGVETTKVAIMNDGKLLSAAVLPAGSLATATVAEQAYGEATESAGVSAKEIASVVATGISAREIPFAGEWATEAFCCAAAADWLWGVEVAVIDVGAQKTLVIRCRAGLPLKISNNDRCAAGAGRFMTMVARLLSIRTEDIGELAVRSTEEVTIQSTCAVFAESEIISLIHLKKKPEDILRGALKGLASRIYSQLLTVGMGGKVCLVGGMARNAGLLKALEELAGSKIVIPEQPEIVGAVGAALIGRKRLES